MTGARRCQQGAERESGPGKAMAVNPRQWLDLLS